MAVIQRIRDLFFLSGETAVERPDIPAPSTTYNIRPITQTHISEVVSLNTRCFRKGENYSKHTFNYLLSEPNSVSYQLRSAENYLAGFIFVLLNRDGAGHITTICIAPEHRRRGLASRLLAHTEATLKAKSISTIMLEVRASNNSAINLYKKLGYNIMQRVSKYYNNGEDGYLMMKPLNTQEPHQTR